MFGAENTGVHAVRVMDVAVVDVALTVAVAYACSAAWRWPFWYTLLGFMCLGILVHRLFCVNSTINKMIFGIV